MSAPAAEVSRVGRAAWWLGASGLATLLAVWLAFSAQYLGFAPLGLLPLATGGAIGAGVVAATRWTRPPRPAVLLLAAAGWALFAVLAQDYLGYRQHLAQRRTAFERSPALAAGGAEPPAEPGFGAFLAERWSQRPALWSLDAALTVAGSVGTAALCASRRTACLKS